MTHTAPPNRPFVTLRDDAQQIPCNAQLSGAQPAPLEGCGAKPASVWLGSGHVGSDSLCDPRPVTEVRPALPFDGLAAAAAVLALVMTVGYVLVLRSQGGESPVVWFLLALIAGAALAGYGAWRGVPHRRGALFGAGAVLLAIGLLAILSIGLPILLAGVLALAAGARARP